MAKIGFIGVGNMGGPMARNLMKKGHQVKAFDLSAEALDRIAKDGAQRAQSVADAARGVDVVVTMVPTGAETRAVYLGEHGIIAAADKGTLLIDSSTIDVETARAVIAEANKAGFEMIDAPVSGGVFGAEAGTLTFMCGGDRKVFEKAKPTLEAMGKAIIYAGGPGNGQAAKICNNMLAGISMIAVSEAYVLGERLGLDHKTLFDIVSVSSGQSFALTRYSPVPGILDGVPANNDYKPGFAASLMAKDLRLAQAAAQQTGASTPLGAAASALYALFCNKGNGGVDSSGIIKMIRGEV
jgi:3-hydroxyisobutyrate dehydrogenase